MYILTKNFLTQWALLTNQTCELSTKFNKKESSLLSRKVDLSAEMVDQIEASVENDKEVSETKTKEEKPLLLDYEDTSPSTRILVHTKIDETECLLRSGKDTEPADVWGMTVQSIVTDLLDNIPFNANDYRFVDGDFEKECVAKNVDDSNAGNVSVENEDACVETASAT